MDDQTSKNGTRVDGLPASRCKIDRQTWLSVGGLPVLVEPLGRERLQAERRARTRLRDAVTRVREALVPDLSGEVLVARGLEAVRRLTDCDRAGLWLVDASSGRRSLACFSGEHEPPPSESVIGRVQATGQAVFCSDTSDADSLAVQESIVAGKIRALVALPMEQEDSTAGVLYADSRKPGKLFTELDRELLLGLCDQLRLALRSARLRSMIEALRDNGPRVAPSEDSQFQRLLEQVFPPYRAK